MQGDTFELSWGGVLYLGGGGGGVINATISLPSSPSGVVGTAVLLVAGAGGWGGWCVLRGMSVLNWATVTAPSISSTPTSLTPRSASQELAAVPVLVCALAERVGGGP